MEEAQAQGKITLVHRFAGIRPTKPGNRSRGGWTLSRAIIASCSRRQVSSLYTSGMRWPSPLAKPALADTAVRRDGSAGRLCAATGSLGVTRPRVPLGLRSQQLAGHVGLLGLRRSSPPRPTWAAVSLPLVPRAYSSLVARAFSLALCSRWPSPGRAHRWPDRLCSGTAVGRLCGCRCSSASAAGGPLQDRRVDRPSGLAAAPPALAVPRQRERAATDAVRDTSPLPGEGPRPRAGPYDICTARGRAPDNSIPKLKDDKLYTRQPVPTAQHRTSSSSALCVKVR